ncbi:DNA topoisomerase I [Gemmobacter megaterium]|uniref:DNA topoisomerase 1 n=1 Tax=Gemmobacter megaterium TaxID=1086013 RepID=A0A1N7NWF5_9RHOB|nr:type I DNA topoisomerase [Gemmobacter megaterium]GGE16238.1 DNA topoisomerase 1 [Gemmobacter megaterium]SIT02628.1 DNA topoisomerase I [Gemmobacter megaterium]
MAVVVVESPAKAKTINKYLGSGYTVLASYGHVRDLPPKDGSVDPEQDFAMTWEVAADSKKHIRAIAEALKTDDELILATDPDREGEAISWHLQQALASSLKKGKKVSRVAFNAITKPAILAAMAKPREVDTALVEAYLARRALDYLVGFTLSPVLWRKLPGARSAGRVQSVVLRLVVEREMEIEAFNAREYWTVTATMITPRGQEITARLTVLGGKKLDKFDLATAEAAELAVAAIQSRDFTAKSVESKPATRNPFPPFMTSTLQQEASRKFGMGSKATMSAAQRLYEAGHITYMRTDGIDMAPEAVMAARDTIKAVFGPAYVPDSPRMYKNKAKNAQEAHECIRPTDLSASPEKLRITDTDQRRLYDLIWKRTIASQMAAARMERTTVDFASPDGQVELRATGQVVQFDGFLKVYDEGRDDEEDEDSRRLPQVMQGEKLDKRDPAPEQHFTQPPPRYTEATLIKRMEELGIGRPSTYTSIVTTIQDRGYVRKDKNRLIPEDTGRLVTAFLTNFFRRYVEYDFTADLEGELDDVSAGERAYQDVLARFWRDFSAAVAETADLRITEVLDKLDEFLAPHLYPPRPDGTDPRSCPVCGAGRLHLKTARSGGAFIGCGNYPECRYTRPISVAANDPAAALDGKVLGTVDGVDVTLRNGRFGPYVQKGEPTEDIPKPPRASLPKSWAPDALTFERAMDLLSLPRQIGAHPEDGAPVEAAIGRFGPFVKHNSTYANLPDVEEVFTIGMNRAVEVLAQKAARGGRPASAASEPLRTLGEHPDGGPVNVMPGRYGPYVKWAKVNATLPKDLTPEDVTLDQALELIAAKASKGGKSGKAKTTKAKAAAPKTAAKQKATAKPKAEAATKPKAAPKPKTAAKPKTTTAAKAAASTAKATARPKTTKATTAKTSAAN